LLFCFFFSPFFCKNNIRISIVLFFYLQIHKINERINLVNVEQSKRVDVADYNKVSEWFDEISELSNNFYELIPHKSFSYTTVEPLTNAQAVAKKIEMINNLTDVCIARKILIGATESKACPIDYCYAALSINLDVLDKQSGEYRALEAYAKNTAQNQQKKIKTIFRLQRRGEAERIQKWKGLDNHYLLWHGSPMANFLGILSEGLRIAPASASVSGHAFGKGIYFSDMFAKSYPYCHGISNESSFLLLCEVALGKMDEQFSFKYMEQPPEGFDSVVGLGKKASRFFRIYRITKWGKNSCS